MQRRVGPKFVGFNGRLQFIADALKIFFKHYFAIKSVKKFYFFLLPLLFLFYNMFFIFNFSGLGNIYIYDTEIHIIFMLFFSSISNLLAFLSGYMCKNKYTIITSSRTISIFFINELVFTVLIMQLFMFSKSLSFNNYICITDCIQKYFI